jgi:hypothetical protein
MIFLLLIPGLVLAACGGETPEPGPQPTTELQSTPESGLQTSPLATPDGDAGLSVLPTPTATLPPPAADLSAVDLVLLHTNDDWGETEPCG